MKIEQLVSVIRSLAQLDNQDSNNAVEQLAKLVWNAENLDTINHKGWFREFNYACNQYLRTYQAQVASDKARSILHSLYTDLAVTVEQFPAPAEWDALLETAESNIGAAYSGCCHVILLEKATAKSAARKSAAKSESSAEHAARYARNTARAAAERAALKA
jgi:hypothetical protein